MQRVVPATLLASRRKRPCRRRIGLSPVRGTQGKDPGCSSRQPGLSALCWPRPRPRSPNQHLPWRPVRGAAVDGAGLPTTPTNNRVAVPEDEGPANRLFSCGRLTAPYSSRSPHRPGASPSERWHYCVAIRSYVSECWSPSWKLSMDRPRLGLRILPLQSLRTTQAE